MPTVPVKTAVRWRTLTYSSHEGGQTDSGGVKGPVTVSTAGQWQVYAQAIDDKDLTYQGAGEVAGFDPSDWHARMSAGGSYGIEQRSVRDASLVTLNLPLPASVMSDGLTRNNRYDTYIPGQLIEGTISYPDEWHGVYIEAIFVFAGDSAYFTRSPFILICIVDGPVLSPFALGTAPYTYANFLTPLWQYHATRVRATGLHTFKFSVAQQNHGEDKKKIANFRTEVAPGEYPIVIDEYPAPSGQADAGRQFVFDWAGTTETVSAPPLNPPPTQGSPPNPTTLAINHTFTDFGAPVSVYVIDGHGQRSETLTLALPPFCKCVLVRSESPLFYFDFGDSYDPDSQVARPNIVGLPNEEGFHVLDMTQTAEILPDDQVYNYPVIVFDNHLPFPLSDGFTIPITIEPLRKIALAHDAGKTLHSAISGGSGIQIYAFPRGVASRETRGTISGKEPSLWGSNALLFCGAYDVANQYHIWRSRDFSAQWEKMTMTAIWDGALYSRAVACGTVGKGAASAAVKKVIAATGAEVYFKHTGDASDWSQSTVRLAGTIPAGSKIIQIRREEGGVGIIITNGFDWARITRDFGENWSDW